MADSKITVTSIVASGSNVRIADLGDSFAILNLNTGLYFDVSGTARAVLEIMREGPVSVFEICSRLTERHNVTLEQCSADVVGFLEEMFDSDLIEVRNR